MRVRVPAAASGASPLECPLEDALERGRFLVRLALGRAADWLTERWALFIISRISIIQASALSTGFYCPNAFSCSATLFPAFPREKRLCLPRFSTSFQASWPQIESSVASAFFCSLRSAPARS